MLAQKITADTVFDTTGFEHSLLEEPDVAHLVVHHNKVLGAHLIPGLHVETQEIEEGLQVKLVLDEGVVVQKPVHICFGMMLERGVQKILMDADIRDNAGIFIYAHCTFPFAIDVQHLMDAQIRIGKGATYTYHERHVHDENGGVKVYPRARIQLGSHARFMTMFELLKGRVGLLDINYETTCHEQSVMEMTARVNGRGNDSIRIKEIGNLIGEGAVGVLTSRVAARDRTTAEVFNELTATAPFARGHVDCKEIIQGKGVARAIPVVNVMHPKAHITHEAAIGSVDAKELETLMSRGLTEDQAVDLIIEGLLS